MNLKDLISKYLKDEAAEPAVPVTSVSKPKTQPKKPNAPLKTELLPQAEEGNDEEWE